MEDRKREKEEDRIARQKIKDQIERDKQERAAKREAEKLAAQGIVKPSSPPTTSTTSSSSNLTASSAKNFTEARIQIRLQNGTALTSTFPATDALEKVYEFVNTEGGAAVVPGFKLSQTFPRKVFGDEDKKKSLKELGLAPSAALIVQL